MDESFDSTPIDWKALLTLKADCRGLDEYKLQEGMPYQIADVELRTKATYYYVYNSYLPFKCYLPLVYRYVCY